MGVTVVCFIMPINSDAKFAAKAEILKGISRRTSLTFDIPSCAADQYTLHDSGHRFNRADLVIADVTYERPSCYYEIGFAEALGKDVQIIAERGTKIHQTLYAGKAIFYSNLREYEDCIGDLLRAHFR